MRFLYENMGDAIITICILALVLTCITAVIVWYYADARKHRLAYTRVSIGITEGEMLKIMGGGSL